jgi:hypothetical protein
MNCLYSLVDRRRRVNALRFSKRSGRKPTCTEKSGRLDVGVTQVVMNCLLRDSEGTTYPNRREISIVYESINGHLRDPHDGGNFRDREELHVPQ